MFNLGHKINFFILILNKRDIPSFKIFLSTCINNVSLKSWNYNMNVTERIINGIPTSKGKWISQNIHVQRIRKYAKLHFRQVNLRTCPLPLTEDFTDSSKQSGSSSIRCIASDVWGTRCTQPATNKTCLLHNYNTQNYKMWCTSNINH